MNWKDIRKRTLNGEVLSGTWIVLGSSLAAEVAGRVGFDWLLLDLEHGMADFESLLAQLQAVEATPAAPIVRVAWNEAPLVKRVLDLGPLGVMLPYINNAEEAERAVRSVRYPPQGIRGLTPLNRPTNFGLDYAEYFKTANDQLLTVIQIESQQGIDSAQEIAAVDGVDVLFVGPMDLSLNMGIPGQFDHPRFRAALKAVADACRASGKAAGILCLGPDQLERTIEDGFSFVALGSDGGQLAVGMKQLAGAFDDYRQS